MIPQILRRIYKLKKKKIQRNSSLKKIIKQNRNRQIKRLVKMERIKKSHKIFQKIIKMLIRKNKQNPINFIIVKRNNSNLNVNCKLVNYLTLYVTLLSQKPFKSFLEITTKEDKRVKNSNKIFRNFILSINPSCIKEIKKQLITYKRKKSMSYFCSRYLKKM